MYRTIIPPQTPTATAPTPNPPESYVFLEANAPGERIGRVKPMESGYYKTLCDNAKDTSAECRGRVQRMNREDGVTPQQAMSMENGSMFGWNRETSTPDYWNKYIDKIAKLY